MFSFSKPLNLLHFPYLIQKEIVASMNAPEIFLLSLCSSKTFNCIQNLKLKVEKAICTVEKNSIVIHVINRGSNSTRQLTVILESVTFGDSMRKFKLGGSRFDCEILGGYCKDGVLLYQFYFPKSAREAVNSAIYQHISSIFHGSFIAVLFDTPLNVIDRPLEPATVTDTLLIGEHTCSTFLDQLFSMYPNQKSTAILPKIDGKLKKDSELFNVENVQICYAGWTATTILQNFNGRILMSSDSLCHDFVIIEMIRKWVSNEGYHNLETVLLRLDSNSQCYFNPDRIFREFEMKDWDDAIPEDFHFLPEIIGLQTAYTFQWKYFSNIQRRCDGKMASVRVWLRGFQFFVWN